MRVVPIDGPLVVGSGLAGLALAAFLSPAPCTVVTAGETGRWTSTSLAQGGIAAAVGPGDSPELHALDTLAAGAGLCEPDVVRAITAAGPGVVDRLVRLGARFDRTPDGAFVLGLEGAHGRRRILHADGDSSGAELLRTVQAAALAAPSVTVMERTRVLRVLVADGAVVGALAERDGERVVLAASEVVLATGGIGGLFAHTTNPLTSQGQGIALAARAGATIRDLEMVQFHPTALLAGVDPMPLVSEAVRGEGAVLVDDRGERFVDPLAARDVVSRASWARIVQGRNVFLDARGVHDFAGHFPGIAATCARAGLDPARDLLPVRPAAHYHMGGVRAGIDGRTDVPGLRAIGECASTGLHGANRLASNSLLEAVACATWAAESLGAGVPQANPSVALRAAAAEDVVAGPAPLPVRDLVERHGGITRDAAGLTRLAADLAPWAAHDDALVGLLLARAALAREESRGGHQRSDHPATAVVAEHTLTHAPTPALELAS